jgi:hypothetical protein
MTPATPLTLRAARRSLRTVPGLDLLGDWQWHDPVHRFALRCRLSISPGPVAAVSGVTEWYILADAGYPRGRVTFYPAAEGGLVATFQHQEYNGPALDGLPWRAGNPCLSTTLRVLGRHGFDTEPAEASGPAGRLRWHALRALDWLRAAADGTLSGPGAPFEVPHFPGAVSSKTTAVFSEGAASFGRWQAIQEQFGVLELAQLRTSSSVLLVTRFMASPKRELMALTWGSATLNTGAVERGVWIRLPRAPVLDPWQGPLTWKELCSACHRQRVNLDNALMRVFRHIRDGARHVLLVGFPMPERVGEAPCRMHWQPVLLPVLCQGNQSLNGFRPNLENTRYRVDRREGLAGSATIEWLASENWDAAQLVSRGSLPGSITGCHVLLVGGGALGSAVGELLMRAGLRRLTVADDEAFQAGNLCRHTLTLPDLKKNKAASLAARLQDLSPHAVVDAIPAAFPPGRAEDVNTAKACDIVIDCTADDGLLRDLARFPWGAPKRFVSLSLGYRAKRLFCFVADGAGFPVGEFQAAMKPWLDLEIQEAGDVEPPREGVGCWHPIFPARADDVWMMASVAVKQLEKALGGGPAGAKLTVFEQRFEAGEFIGVLRAEGEVRHAG